MKIASIVGTRPNFVKAVLLSKEIRRKNKEILIHAGQHYDYQMNKIFFDELAIPEPNYHLGVGSGTHAYQTGEMMKKIEKVLMKERPDLALVYGDCNSTLAGALAAVKLHCLIAHVEAGPRFFDKSVPEEVNRVLTDHVSTLLFAPTQIAVDNLKREGIEQGVYLTGDVMLDSFLHFSKVAERSSKILDRLGLSKGEYLLATVHRARNTDIKENLGNLVSVFLDIGEKIIFPIHPRTEKHLKQFGLFNKLKNAPNIKLIPPVGYLDSISLTKNAKKVLTDSGGLQKEAYFSKVPCITLDEATGWPETVEVEWNILVGTNKRKIIEAVKQFEPKGKQKNIFGSGRAREKITSIISRFELEKNT